MEGIQPTGKIEFANTLRGPACLLVLLFHYLTCFWHDRDIIAVLANLPIVPTETHALPKYVQFLDDFGLLFYWGLFGVALFFLISGFVIPFSLLKTNRIGFFIARFFRLFPTYAVALSFTFLVIWLGDIYFAKEFPHPTRSVLLHYLLGIRDMIGSSRIDGVSWTLDIEIKFYVLCLLMLYPIRRGSLMIFLAPLIIAVAAFYLSPIVNPKTYSHVAEFIVFSPFLIYLFIGIVFNYLFRKLITVNTALFLMISLLTTSLFIFQISHEYSFRDHRFVSSLIFGVLVFTVAFFYPKICRGNRILNFFAAISYPLYLIHFIPGFVILRILLDLGFKAWLSYIITTSLMIIMAYLLHKTVEVPTQAFGKSFPKSLKGWTTKGLVGGSSPGIRH